MRTLLALILTLICTTTLANDSRTINVTAGRTTLPAVNIFVPEGFRLTNSEVTWQKFNPVCPVTLGYVLNATNVCIVVEPQVYGMAINDPKIQGTDVAGVPASNRVPTVKDIVDADFASKKLKILEIEEPQPGIARVMFEKDKNTVGAAMIRIETLKNETYTIWTFNVVAIIGGADEVLKSRAALRATLNSTRPTPEMALSIQRLMAVDTHTNAEAVPAVREKIVNEAMQADTATKAKALQEVSAGIDASVALLDGVL